MKSNLNNNLSPPSPPAFAISVIIPLYNAEKYIGECLDSLLNQTFKNFEVILVDDCSTDNSVKIVESYAPKFAGRLKLAKMGKNTGSGSLPRNKGLLLSRGEYIFNMDNDDLLTETALEEMYTLAKKYNVDFVYCERYYSADVHLENRFVTSFHRESTLVNEPTVVLPLLPECLDKVWVTPWTKLIKRKLLIEHQIFLPNIIRDDTIWTWCLLFYAKRFLRVPNAVYIWRDVPNSITRSDKNPEQIINFWLNPVILGVKILDDRLQKIEFFQKNPQERYALLENFIQGSFKSRGMLKFRRQINSSDIFNAIKEKFAESLGEYDILVPALCAILINEEITREDVEKTYINFQKFFTARIDITFSSKNKNDLRIISVSDDTAIVKRAIWLPKDKIGYFIQSHVGKINLVAKVISDGQISIDLKGMDIRTPEDKSKRIPYWIDYTKLTINGKAIFDKITPAWHDKAYNYKLDVKAGEEIELQTEWLPHQGDLSAVETPQVKPLIADKFLPYLTARLDVHFATEKGGNLRIISVSDDNAEVKKPTWLQKTGVGYTIQSHAGDMKIVSKVTSDGQISINLKGMDIRTPEDKSKRIPYWIDYTKLTVNGKAIFDQITPAWHDKAYNYKLDVKAGEEIELQTEWSPHQGDLPAVETPQVKPLIADKFLPYLTARLDVHFETEKGGNFQIISVSDDNAEIRKPAWFQKNGVGYIIQSHAGDMKIVSKVTSDGQISVKLRGMNIRAPEYKTKRVPYWVDYTKLTINGKAIFDKITSAWHDKTYNYKFEVKAGEEIELQTEWLPHLSDT